MKLEHANGPLGSHGGRGGTSHFWQGLNQHVANARQSGVRVFRVMWQVWQVAWPSPFLSLLPALCPPGFLWRLHLSPGGSGCVSPLVGRRQLELVSECGEQVLVPW